MLQKKHIARDMIVLSTHQLVGLEVAPEGGALECSSLVQGESLAMLSGEVEKGQLPFR